LKRIAAAVIGLGRIGQGYDYAAPATQSVLTHAQAFAAHPAFELVGAVDPLPAERERFTRKFSAPAYPDIGSLAAERHAEVYALAVPTPLHAALLHEVLAHRPRAVICEKPFARTLAEGEAMAAAARSRGCSLIVNYMRRFEPGTRALAHALREGALGEVYKAVAWYSNGLRHSGSHMVDLLCFLLGATASVEAVLRGREWQGGDPEPDAVLRFGAARVALLAAREECFSLHALELVGTRGSARYADGGEQIVCHGNAIPSDMGRYQLHVADALASHLAHGAPLASDAQSALASLAIIEDIVKRMP
jgi:predicted dehydrogenase